MKLGIDAMSGDLGSKEVVQACLNFLESDSYTELVVVGKKEELSDLEGKERVTIVDAREVLEMTENILAIRRKKESSLVKTLTLGKKGEVDAVVSCGNTGAYFASAMLFLKSKRLEGCQRPCLMGFMPTLSGKGSLMLDCGANSHNTSEELLSFAIMGSVYAKNIKGIDNPTVGLLNIGAEDHKGDDVHKEAYKLLDQSSNVNFIGNIEGRDVLMDCCDVIVTDGFSGNIAMKSMEGTMKMLVKCLKDTLMSSTKSKIGAMLIKDSLKSMLARFDAKEIGGALMIGFDLPVIKAHGASDAKAFESAMHLASEMVKLEVTSKMKEGLK